MNIIAITAIIGILAAGLVASTMIVQPASAYGWFRHPHFHPGHNYRAGGGGYIGSEPGTGGAGGGIVGHSPYVP